jgi:hypothetical protein
MEDMFLLDPLHLDNSGRDPAQRGGSLTLAPLKGMPHMFKKVGSGMKIGGSRYTKFGLDTCLPLRSLVSRLVPFWGS